MKVYGCKYCGMVLTSERTPSHAGCPDTKHGKSHSWYEAGDSGDKTYSCQNCGAMVSCDRNPSSNGCSSGSHQYHSWNEVGTGYGNNRSATNVELFNENKKSSESKDDNQTESKLNTENIQFDDTLLGKGMSAVGSGIQSILDNRKEKKKQAKIEHEADVEAFENEMREEENEEIRAYSRSVEKLDIQLPSEISGITDIINSNVNKLNSYSSVSINCIVDSDKDWLKRSVNRELIADLESVVSSLIDINNGLNK